MTSLLQRLKKNRSLIDNLKKLTPLIYLPLCLSFNLSAATLTVKPTDNLQSILDSADSGDQIYLSKGIYKGNFIVSKSILLKGEDGVILDGDGKGHTLNIQAENITVQNLTIQNWGDDLTDMDAGLFIDKRAENAHIENLYVHGITFGIWVDATKGVKLLNNKIEGVLDIRSQDRGNGIHLYNVRTALVKDNEIWHTRDGIYIDNSNNNELIGNYMHDLRYGVHYMYSYNNIVSDNITQRTRTGYALMQSKFLTVTGNVSDNDMNYGILMNFITKSTITGNRIVGVQNNKNPQMRAGVSKNRGGEAKALFMYNSLFNKIEDNLFAKSDIGIHLTAGSEDNSIVGNAFVGNKEQVKYVATITQDWSNENHGNYWSDYMGWDMDSDGIGDTHYEPNDGVDRLLWKFPTAKLLFNSPAIETLRWVQRQFPVLKSEGVIDSKPLMAMPEIGKKSDVVTALVEGEVL